MTDFKLRPATIHDNNGIYDLYKSVSNNDNGLARKNEEITEEYINYFSVRSSNTGIQLVIVNSADNVIIGEIHCYKLEPVVFDHVLSELTIAVHPGYQGRGLGKLLFSGMLEKIKQERIDILRVELIARESNEKAINFYTSLGFKIEGRLVNRIKSGAAGFEADIPMAWMNVNYQG